MIVENNLLLQGIDFPVLWIPLCGAKFNSSINLDTCLRCRCEFRDDILTHLPGLLLGMHSQRFGVYHFCHEIDIQQEVSYELTDVNSVHFTDILLFFQFLVAGNWPQLV